MYSFGMYVCIFRSCCGVEANRASENLTGCRGLVRAEPQLLGNLDSLPEMEHDTQSHSKSVTNIAVPYQILAAIIL